MKIADNLDNIDKVYNPFILEKKWFPAWQQSGRFKANGDKTRPYCIMLPPPNVTGTLHMGHAFQDAIMDALIRLHRMQGDHTHWQLGVDHAGIATQMVVERNLLAANMSRTDLGREKFIEQVFLWKEQSEQTIKGQLERLGVSGDWEQKCFTMDPNFCSAVQKTFIDLFRDGLIYRSNRLVNWDPVLKTAVSDLEVVMQEETGQLSYIKYQVVGTNEYLTVATTRPETIFGDTAIAVHPDDPRYQAYIGKTALIPICSRQIPIIADPHVEQDFGTGCLKITPAHDFNDYAIAKRHNLDFINILNADATLNHNVPESYQKLDRFLAREKLLAELKASNLLAKTESHTLKIPRGDRGNAILEPRLMEQWFVKVKPLAELAIQAVKTKQVVFHPENWEKVFFDWMYNIEDWCISRQLWWGHRIPAWFDNANNIYVGASLEEIRNKYQLSQDIELKQDEDVLDTWFSAALWPFTTLGWPNIDNANEKLKLFYPTNVLVTGFDIIFFWVARMLMFGLKFMQQVPFKEVYIHGLIQDQNGQKMSKTKGNVIDPLDVMDGIDLESLLKKRTSGLMQPQLKEKIIQDTKAQYPNGIAAYGVDALRFTFYSLATNTRYVRFEISKVESSRNFCNKLWNASRFVIMQCNLHNEIFASFKIEQKTNLAAINNPNNVDSWIISIWQTSKQQILEYFNKYRFDLAAHAIYEFVWHEYCDWYVEFAKVLLQDPKVDAKHKTSALATLINLLREIIACLHPMMPFITEEIWEKIAPHTSLLISEQYPMVNLALINANAEAEVTWIKNFANAIRNIRSELNIAPSVQITVTLQNNTATNLKYFYHNQGLLQALLKIKNFNFTQEHEIIDGSVAILDNLKIIVPFADLINKEQEINRLQRELAKLKKEREIAETKLSNADYINKAPKAVVEKEQDKLKAIALTMTKLEHNLNLLVTN